MRSTKTNILLSCALAAGCAVPSSEAQSVKHEVKNAKPQAGIIGRMVGKLTTLSVMGQESDHRSTTVTLGTGSQSECGITVNFDYGHHMYEPNPSVVVAGGLYGVIQDVKNDKLTYTDRVGHTDNLGIEELVIPGSVDFSAPEQQELRSYIQNNYRLACE